MSALDSLGAWRRKRGFWHDAAWRFGQNRLAVFGLVMSILIIALSYGAPWIAPHPYDLGDYGRIGEPPSWSAWMGTDDLGRDVLSRVLYGGRVSISIGVQVQVLALLIGAPLGVLAAYFGGWVDFAITRLIDVMMGFPSLMLAIVLMVVLGPGYTNVLFTMVIVAWPFVCRLVRARVLQLREAEFVTAARAVGASDRRIMFRHILPHVSGPIIVAFTLGIPATIFREAGLSFLGIGILPPTPSWGQMIGEYYQQIHTYWHIAVFPALALGLAILVFTFTGNGLEDALAPGSDR
jgi:ABC-type dipeptide/oligopeptide/nickel transport system permease subunit